MQLLKELPYGKVVLHEPSVVNDIRILKKLKGEYILLDFYDYKRLERGWIVKSKSVTGLHYDMTRKEFYDKIEIELQNGYRFVAIPRNWSRLPSDYVYDKLTELLDSVPRSALDVILKAEANGLYDEV